MIALDLHRESARLRAAPQTAPPPGFIELFLRQAAARPNAVAVETEAGPTTYAALCERMERLRGALEALDVAEGDRVLVRLANGPDLIAAFYALASMGAVAVPVSAALTEHELAPILADARPSGAIVARPSGAPHGLRFELACSEIEGARRRPITAPKGDPFVTCHFTYKGLGHPLGALHRYSAWAYCLRGFIERHGGSSDDLHLVALPMYPVYGLTVSVMWPLALGARIVVAPPDAEVLLDLLTTRSVRVACLVPALLHMLCVRARRTGLDRAALHPDLELKCGGSDLGRALSDEVRAVFGVVPHEGYGLSEALIVASSFPGRVRPVTLGVALADEIRIGVVDASGRPVPAGRVGEITIAGPTVFRGYIGRPSETARFLRDGVLHTGDLGHFDEEGSLHFDGRAVPIAKISAQMVDLREVEDVLRRHPDVADARVVVHVDDAGVERLHAAVIPRRASDVSPEALVASCRQRLSRHKVPKAVRFYQREVAPVRARGLGEKEPLR